MEQLSREENKNKVAIVVVGYNRLKSIKRLIDSLLSASYPSNDIPLVISIDASGDQDLYNYVNDLIWPFGEKIINIQKIRLGLKEHIYKCGDLTRFFRAIILLEDDLFVSPNFYSYVLQTLDKYGACDNIAEISLYKNERNGYVGLPFENYQNGSDVFLMQDVSTWGQCWNARMWNSFVQWRDNHTEEYIQSVDMPDIIKKWERAWSKYFNAYVVDTAKYVLYPNVAVTTNFSDAGEHGGDNNSIVQVNLLQRDVTYRLYDFDELVKYDIYFNNVSIPIWLGIKENEVCLDLYGFHNLEKSFILSTRHLPYKVIKSFPLFMRPLELNIKYGLTGDGIYLYDTSLPSKGDMRYSREIAPYYMRGFCFRPLFHYVLNKAVERVKKKFL